MSQTKDNFPEMVLGIASDDIPKADDRDEWDVDQEPEEPEDLYDEDDPRYDHRPIETPEPR